ncbi:hypothetical protein [Arthrobacter globiformis]|jgi:hypothetical protein|uniref:hypothetical protein n=1 Tax=Arthrobacter globiformis TaxID=1665 RepID=UPI00278F5D98|nr:hypothetical protein [Arthrobacter globiformis]MDQ0618077.1 hypothetical protein [Arthrobacter globiformis]
MRLIVRILAPIFLVLGLIGPAGAATAAPAQTERNFTFAFDFNTCNGEAIEGQGFVHVVSKEQADGSFLNRITLHAKGVGSEGNEYVMNWTQVQRFFTDHVEFTAHTRAISKGSAPNQDLHATVNTATNVFTFDPVCHG